MPGNGSDTQPTMTYPTEDQHARWKEQAEEMDMSLSEFVQAMTEAGMKKFDVEVKADESFEELRRSRNDLKQELDRTRSRVSKLEEQMQRGERAAIKDYIEENPGAEFDEITQHVVKTATDRVLKQLEDMETVDEIEVEDGKYFV